MTIKTTKFALALVGALAFAAPFALGTTAAQAAPMHGGSMMMGGHDSFHDRSHRPPMRHESRTRSPHRGYHWHDGQWKWQHNQWEWIVGFWNIH